MTENVARLVVVGHGAAGLAAALSAAEQARHRRLHLDITLLEKSGEADAGGNTRWSPSYMRHDGVGIDGRRVTRARVSENIAQKGNKMTSEDNGAFIRNIAEVPWREFPNHFGGALSKPLVMPETAGARHLDYRISMCQPMAHVTRHQHRFQEQIYHVLEGEGLMEIAGKNHVVRKHDVIFLPPGVEHAISNSGLVDLVFLVITSPVSDGGA